MRGPIASGSILLVGVFVFLKFILPLFTAPLPASLIYLYMALTFSGIMIFGTMSASSLESLMGPVFRFLSGEGQSGTSKMARLAVLVLFPLLVGWQTYTSLAPSDLPPVQRYRPSSTSVRSPNATRSCT